MRKPFCFLLKEEVRVALDEGLDEGIIVGTFQIGLDQIDLATDEVLLILEDKFGEVVEDFHDIARLDFVVLLQQVEKTHEVADATGQNTTAT